jgi:TRAP-type uncharacterized transport system fused permease subunit
MTIALVIVGFVIMGSITTLWGRNVLLNSLFREQLEKYNRKYRSDADEENAELALAAAKSEMEDFIPFIPLAFLFWPLVVVFLLGYAAFCLIRRVSFFQSKAERQVKAMRKNKALTETRKAEWDNAFKALEDSGINTEELRKMQID